MSLYYCNTNYDCKPPLDLNPLILRRYPTGNILALCARDGMLHRINNNMDLWPYSEYPEQSIVGVGWWEAKEFGLVDARGRFEPHDLLSQDAVVIVGKDRIDPMFHALLEAVEAAFCAPLTPAA